MALWLEARGGVYLQPTTCFKTERSAEFGVGSSEFVVGAFRIPHSTFRTSLGFEMSCRATRFCEVLLLCRKPGGWRAGRAAANSDFSPTSFVSEKNLLGGKRLARQDPPGRGPTDLFDRARCSKNGVDGARRLPLAHTPSRSATHPGAAPSPEEVSRHSVQKINGLRANPRLSSIDSQRYLFIDNELCE